MWKLYGKIWQAISFIFPLSPFLSLSHFHSFSRINLRKSIQNPSWKIYANEMPFLSLSNLIYVHHCILCYVWITTTIINRKDVRLPVQLQRAMAAEVSTYKFIDFLLNQVDSCISIIFNYYFSILSFLLLC